MNTIVIKKIIISLILIFCTNTLTASESVNSYEYLKVEILNEIKYGITKENNAQIEELSLTSYFFPKNYDESQALNELTSTHNYNVKETNTSTYLFFDIKEFSESTNKISNSFTVQSTINKPKISQKISFPIEDKTSNHQTYTSFSGLIDTNDAIYTQASALAQGEDDVFIIASKVAKWIQEDITYDLSTITQNPNQKSSEVFISKAGVCQEITHLFISMMRSLDIPARVVTGYAYTNSQEVIDLVGSNWGGHAWAEVLIGNTWVPFDLTYNQYGYVDASHIVLDKSKEIRKQSILVEGKGRNFQITPNSLSNENLFTVVEKEKQILDPGFSIELSGPQELSPQSYGHIKVTVENTKDYYQNIFLNLAKVNEVELLDRESQMIILKPNEEKEIIFRYKMPELEKGFIYTFPFTIYNQFFEQEFEVKVEHGAEKIEEYELPEVVVESQIFSDNDLQLSCSGEVSFPENILLCTIKNPNNYEIYNAQICTESICEKISLRVNEQKTIELKTQEFNEEITLEYNNLKQTSTLSIAKPKLINSNISLDKQTLNVEYEIENRYESISSTITINETINTFFDKKISQNYKLTPGTYEVSIELKNGEKTLETITKLLTVEELTLVEKISKFFSNIYELLF